MKRFYSTCFLLVFSLATAYAQTSAVLGRIADASTRQPLEYASVTLHLAADSALVEGTVTNAEGYFEILKLKPGSYYLQTFFMGYKTHRQPLRLDRGQRLDLGTLAMAVDAKVLDAVNVTGQRAAVTTQLDRQIYRADQFQSAVGGTAVDVLRNMPSVTVNAEGEVSLRGSSGFLVLLNGKPIQSDLVALLNQLPANAIENIEIITTPSARYDPDGKGGIINITTRKGASDGFSVLANAQLGLPSVQDFDNAEKPQRYGADLTLNYRRDKWDISVGGNYLRNDIAGRREGDVRTTIGNRLTRFPSVGERSFDRYNHSARASVAYEPSKTDAFSAGFYYGHRTEYRLADILYNNTTQDLTTGQTIGQITYFNSNLVKKRGEFYSGTFDYTHTFANKATLMASALYEYDYLDGYTKNRNLDERDFRDTLQYTLTTTARPLRGYRAALDYSLPLGTRKLELGYQYRNQQDDGTFVYLEKEGNFTPLVLFPEFTGSINVDNQIHSLYSQYSGRTRRLEYLAGLRFEYATRDVRVGPGTQTFDLRLTNLFPSVNLLYTFDDHLKGKAGYSRRVQRTNNFALNPLPEREHSETLEQGDPNLLPEFVGLSELGLIRTFDKGSWFATLYHQQITNVINRVNSVYADTILNRIFTNAGTARRWGLELGLDVEPVKGWKLYLGGNLYDYRIRGQLFENTVVFNNNSLVYSLNGNSSVQLSPTLTWQTNLNYLSRRITAQGEDSRFVIPNTSLKKTFLKGRLATTLQWQNMSLGLLKSNEQRITTSGLDFFTTTNYILEKDIFMLNVSYSLNQLSKRSKLPTNEFGEKEF
ncbi:outer membrane beta-barrel family protein [Rhabdobacter roseus]|uniref:Outer membrane receptor protein involved in Fe transport n=1 Tax=Rhabdobacter roseus TaxID=1655419 RepID=A0A840TVF8_9BACT|nr:TonB-dependent receptor [Rhabdobacter roseus]MBB5284098.1 outer membrane receptor protein involved in Fe transport [Rhabdobacter roseus]